MGKEIDDKTPKLRTEDEKKMLKSLSSKMRKFPKDLIDGIQKKFPFLQRTPRTAEQRQEQVKECNRQKRSAESETDKEMRLKKQKQYDHEKRFCLLHSFTCSCLCSAVLGVLCKNGNFFWMPSIKSLGNFLILLLKDFNFFFSSSVLNFGVLSSISFFL